MNPDTPPTILLVDDEPSIIRAIQRLLRRDGYRILTADGGAQAIEILQAETIHLLICDQRMPQVPGPEVLAKAYELQPDAYRITLTGYTDLEAAQKSINDGHVNQFLMKPCENDQLRSAVADGLRSYELVVENRRLQLLTQQQNDQLAEFNKTLEDKVQQRTEQLRKRNELLTRVQAVMEDSLRDTVGIFASILDLYDPALGTHSNRVAAEARRIGQRMGVDETTLREIEFAAKLHEIGQIANLDPALDRRATGKPRDVNDAGYRMLARVRGFKRVAEGIKHQGEHYDGTGQPSRLRRESIPLIARILAVADAYDTAVYADPDPTRLDRAAGQHVLETESGNQLDPDICKAMLSHLKPVAKQAAEDVEVELSPRQIRPGMILTHDLSNTNGVLLIKAGTTITRELATHIRGLSSTEILLNTIRVKTSASSDQASPNAA